MMQLLLKFAIFSSFSFHNLKIVFQIEWKIKVTNIN